MLIKTRIRPQEISKLFFAKPNWLLTTFKCVSKDQMNKSEASDPGEESDQQLQENTDDKNKAA